MFGRGLKLLILFFFSASLVVGLFGSRCYAAEGVVISLDGSLVTIAFPHPYGIKKMMAKHKSITKI